MRKILGAMLLALAVVTPMASLADDAARVQLAGRTLDVVVAFSNSGGGARFWNIFAEALRRQLPDTVIRARFNDAGSGTSAANELFAMPEGSLAIGFVRPAELAFAQAQGREDVSYDLNTAKWITAVEKESTFMAARRGLSLDMEELRAPGKTLIVPVNAITDTQSIIAAMLNAVTGVRGRLVVGFGNADRLRALLAGDGDLYTQAKDDEIGPLLESGDLQALYVLGGTDFPPIVDQSRTLASVAVPGVPQKLLDYIIAARGLGRAFYAPPGVSDEDVAALRSAFAGAMHDAEFRAQAQKQIVPIADVTAAEVETQMDLLMLKDPELKAAVDKAFACGMAMSEGTADHCDFGS